MKKGPAKLHRRRPQIRSVNHDASEARAEWEKSFFYTGYGTVSLTSAERRAAEDVQLRVERDLAQAKRKARGLKR